MIQVTDSCEYNSTYGIHRNFCREKATYKLVRNQESYIASDYFDPWSQLIGGASSIIVYYDPANLQGQKCRKKLIRGHWNASGVIGAGHRGKWGK